MTHDSIQELFVGALYGELTENEKVQFDEHLATCDTCRVKFRELQETANIMNLRRREEPNADDWSRFWPELSAKLNDPASPRRKIFNLFPDAARVPAWAYGIAAVLLIAFGVYVGRNYFATLEVPVGSGIATSTQHIQAAPADTLNERALAYLDRSRNLLIGLMNLDQENRSSFTLSRQQDVSRELLQQSHYLQAALTRPDQQLMRQLLLDLEVILLQLANVESSEGTPAIELMQKGVDQKSILLKINLEELRAIAKRPASSNKVTNSRTL